MPDASPTGDDTTAAAAMSMLTDHANSHAGEHGLPADAGPPPGLRDAVARALADRLGAGTLLPTTRGVTTGNGLTPTAFDLADTALAVIREHAEAAAEELWHSEQRGTQISEALRETLENLRGHQVMLNDETSARLAATQRAEQAEATLARIRVLANVLTGMAQGLEATYGEYAAHPIHTLQRELHNALDGAGVSEDGAGATASQPPAFATGGIVTPPVFGEDRPPASRTFTRFTDADRERARELLKAAVSTFLGGDERNQHAGTEEPTGGGEHAPATSQQPPTLGATTTEETP